MTYRLHSFGHCTSSFLNKLINTRSFSTGSSNAVFDRSRKCVQRDRAVRGNKYQDFDYLRKHVIAQQIDRLRDIIRSFPLVLELGSHTGHFLDEIIANSSQSPTAKETFCGIETLFQTDMSSECLKRAARNKPGDNGHLPEVHQVRIDEEFLPFAPNSFDLVLSSLNLHWVNDLPRAMSEIKSVLKPDGAFVGAILGGETLHELRHCLLLAEQEREGGISPHVSPMVQVSDCGNLLSQAGFTMPTVDTEFIEVLYPSIFHLMEDIHGMGEQSALKTVHHHRRIGLETLVGAGAIYQELYGREVHENENGNEPGPPTKCIPATFQVIHMIGWAPHHSQPKPLRRGSAIATFHDLGDKAKTQGEGNGEGGDDGK